MARSTSPDPLPLLATMRAEALRRKGPPCSMGVILDALTDDERAQMLEAFDDKAITGAVIADVLSRHGHKITGPTVIRHRQGRCACGAR